MIKQCVLHLREEDELLMLPSATRSDTEDNDLLEKECVEDETLPDF